VSRTRTSVDRRKERAEQLRHRRKTEILAAARRVFSIKGYHRSSIADILEAAGIARGTFYLYFSSKRAIFEELLEGMLGQIRGAVVRIQLDSNQAGSPLEQLQGNVRRVIDVLEENRELTIILLREAVGLDTDFDQKLTTFYQRLAGMIESALQLGQAMGLVRSCEIRVVSSCVLGSLKEMMLRVLTESDAPWSRDVLAREILDYNLHGLFSRPI
jgi:AcrR family transcriptional regulator